MRVVVTAVLVVVRVVVVVSGVLVVMMAGLRGALPVFAPDDGRTIRAKLAIHVRVAAFRFTQPLQEGGDHQRVSVQIRGDRRSHLGVATLVVGHGSSYLLDQTASK